MNFVTFESLIRSIEASVVKSTEVLETHHIQRLLDYFEPDGTPKTVTLTLEGKKIKVPVFTLVNHQSLAIDELEMEFRTRLCDFEFVDKEPHLVCDIKKQDPNNPDSFANVRIKFKINDKPESVSRICDDLLKDFKYQEENTEPDPSNITTITAPPSGVPPVSEYEDRL